MSIFPGPFPVLPKSRQCRPSSPGSDLSADLRVTCSSLLKTLGIAVHFPEMGKKSKILLVSGWESPRK